jgi:putative flippase GtrA
VFNSVRQQLIRFVIAGVVGFVVDAGILYLGLAVGLGYFSESAWVEWWRYLVAMSVGGVVNYCAYSATVLTLKGLPFLPIVAVAVGSLAGMVVNFATAKMWVFKQR